MKNNNLSLINIVCGILILFSLIITIAIKSSVTFSDLFFGNWQLNITAAKEIGFNICMGIIASAILTLFIEWSNKHTLNKRNIGVKKVIMRKYAFIAEKALSELTSGTDRDLLSVIYNYHHLEFLVSKRLTELKSYGEYFIENYTDIFEQEEIELLNKINGQCQFIQNLTEGPYKEHVLLFDSQLSRYYSSKKYEDLPLGINSELDKIVTDNLKILDGIVSTNEKHIKPIIELLTKLKQQMPYLFDRNKDTAKK